MRKSILVLPAAAFLHPLITSSRYWLGHPGRRSKQLLSLVILLVFSALTLVASAAVLKAGTGAQLVAAINIANGSVATDIIELTDDIVLTAVDNDSSGPNGLPAITTSLVLVGNGHSISRDTSAPQFRLFAVLGGFFGYGELTLDNVRVADGDLSSAVPPASPCFANLDICGGAIIVLAGDLTLRNGAILQNNAAYSGGGIFTAGSRVHLADSYLLGNRADYGGAVASQPLSAGELRIRHTEFSDNESAVAGGAISNGTTMVISDSIFTGNRVTTAASSFGGGGAIYNTSIRGQAQITTSLLTDNEAFKGGAIMNFNAADLILRNCDVVANRVGFGSGGGIYNDGSGAVLTIIDSRVNDNDASVFFGSGGGIFSGDGGSLILENCEVTRNLASNDGGGAVASAGRIANSRIENNRSVSGEGGGLYHSGLKGLEIIASSISGNMARYDGGGLATFVGTSNQPAGISISDSRISSNTSEFGSGGGIANTEQGRVSILRSLVSGNTALASGIGGFGGGVFSDNTLSETVISNSTIFNNTASNGGGVYNSNASTMMIDHSTITNNVASSQSGAGGAVAFATMHVSDSIIANNVGGADRPNCFDLGLMVDDGGNFTNDGGAALYPCPASFTVTEELNIGSLVDNGGPTRTQALLPGSAAIDGGMNCNVLTDQRGVPRPVACDAGAYEGDVVFPQLQFELATSDVDESPGGAHEVFLRLDNTAGTIEDGELEVFVTIDGLAAATSDYDLTAAPPLIFGNGNWPAPGTISRQALEFNILPDFTLEGDETISLNLRGGGFRGPASLASIDKHTVTVADALADLQVEKYVDATDLVLPGEAVTFEVRVRNLGPTDAANVSVYDPLDGVALDIATASVTASVGVFNPATGDWSLDGTLQGNGFALPAGSEETLTVTARVTAATAGTIINTAELSRYFPAMSADPYPDNDASQVSFDVCDSIPPALSIELSRDTLWPPNHKLVAVSATVTASDDTAAQPDVVLISVTSNEPDNSLGDGDAENDIVILNDTSFSLRAERSGLGDGRVYTVTYEATDECGNSAVKSAEVRVPKSRGG